MFAHQPGPDARTCTCEEGNGLTYDYGVRDGLTSVHTRVSLQFGRRFIHLPTPSIRTHMILASLLGVGRSSPASGGRQHRNSRPPPLSASTHSNHKKKRHPTGGVFQSLWCCQSHAPASRAQVLEQRLCTVARSISANTMQPHLTCAWHSSIKSLLF